MQWWLAALKNYAGFSGRARRTEFWMFFLFQAIIFAVLLILGQFSSAFQIIYYVYAVATLLPYLAVGARRLHDANQSAFWLFILLVPLIGLIVCIVFWSMDSTPGPNQHGPNPKDPSGAGWQGQVQAPAWPSYPPTDQPYGQGQPPYPQGQQPYPQGQQPYPQGQPQYPQYPPQGQGYQQQPGQPPYPGQ
ncbi:MAG TPA: DUF805 domain-containing protein [Micromonosporaceae bacterium]|jgi:uncharacterized membrane protein YhaH (DUF805 family)